jgi:hypothetical protein
MHFLVLLLALRHTSNPETLALDQKKLGMALFSQSAFTQLPLTLLVAQQWLLRITAQTLPRQLRQLASVTRLLAGQQLMVAP